MARTIVRHCANREIRIGWYNRIVPKDADPRPDEMPLYPPLDETGTVDLYQLEASLRLTPAARIRQLQQFINFAHAARKARIKRYGYDPAIAAAAETAE
jgi:hypothetical protein